MSHTCVQCREPASTKPLRGEKRPHFCSRKCAVTFAINEVAKRTGCPRCGSTFYHRTREEYGHGGDHVCEECNHTWE